MHIVFVHNYYENLGIEYVSAYLKKAGHKTSLVFEPGLFSSFFMHHKLAHKVFSFKNEIVRKVVELKPDIIAFSVISDNYSWAANIASEIKKKVKTVIVFGGIHPTSVPEMVLRNDFVDYVVIGEGEEAMLELTQALENGKDGLDIPNIGSKVNGSMRINRVRPAIDDLDKVPFPDKDLFYKEYKRMINSSYMIMGSRGCIYNCSYCWNSVINNVYSDSRYFRKRSPGNIIEELLWARANYGIKRVTFYDEVFTSDKVWLKEFLQRYKENISLPFFCCVHPSGIDEESIEMLSSAGCAAVNMGIQTIDKETRRIVLGRGESNEQISRVLGLLSKTNIYVYTNIMLGIPGQKEEELLENLKFCNENKADLPAIYWLRYYPRTKIIQIARQASLITDQEINIIENSYEYEPYAIKGSTYTKNAAKIGNLILISGMFPKRTMDFIIKHRLYRFMPSNNMLFPVIFSSGVFKKLIHRKREPFHYFSPFDYLRYYVFYMQKILFTWILGSRVQ